MSIPPVSGLQASRISASAAQAGSQSRTGELFQLLRDGRARTRAELAELTGLARSTVAARVDALSSLGLIGPAGEAFSSGGRPPSRFAFQPSARIVMAVDVGATHILVAATNLSGRVLSESRVDIEISAGPPAVLDLVVQLCSTLLAKSGRDVRELAGVGIGLPGPVEHSSGKPADPPIMPGWDGFDVPHYIQRSFDTHVVVDNDVNIMALGERAFFLAGRRQPAVYQSRYRNRGRHHQRRPAAARRRWHCRGHRARPGAARGWPSVPLRQLRMPGSAGLGPRGGGRADRRGSARRNR